MMPADSPDAVGSIAARGAHACAAGMNPAVAATQPQGVDVASYQHPGGAGINWGAVAASGQRFAVVKATESTSYTNPYFASDVNGARAAGMYVSAYHYALPASAAPAVAQAHYFAQAFNAVGGTLLPPVLDLEDNGGLSPQDLINWTAAFLGTLQAETGRVPMIYTGPSFWNTSMAGTTAFTNYPLWVAHYTSCVLPQQFGGWGNWTFWQFSNGSYNTPTPSVPGIASDVDRNRASGTDADLAALAIGPFNGTATQAQFPDGAFVQVAGTPAVYRIAGLSPIYVSNWANVGGVQPVRIVSAKEFSTLRAHPLDGTFLHGLLTGAVYRVVGGAPLYVSTFAPFGGVSYVDVDEIAVNNAGGGGYYRQLSAVPADGTFLNALPSGAVYRIAGGAPVYISNWAPIGGVQPCVTVNDATVANAGQAGFWSHLRFRPAEGTFLNTLPSGGVYRVNSSGAPVYVPSWNPYLVNGALPPYVNVNDATVANAGQAGFWAHLA
jgi:lysozyme